jgi:two-component system phosphate regulon response regulator PhoB
LALVLVVMADPDHAELVGIMLADAEHKVVQAANGIEGVDLARRWNPDVAILERRPVGGLGGLDVCRLLREERSVAQIPVLLLSETTFGPDSDASRAQGVNDILVKPFSTTELRARVSALLHG